MAKKTRGSRVRETRSMASATKRGQGKIVERKRGKRVLRT